MNRDVISVQHKGDCSCFALLLLFHITLVKEVSHLITHAHPEAFNSSVPCFVIAARDGYSIYSAIKRAHQLQEATFSWNSLSSGLFFF